MKKMRFDILTIFPGAFHSYLETSILGRAIEKKKIDVHIHDLRTYSPDTKHHKVDDRPYGGGPGMVMRVDVFDRALKAIVRKRTSKTRVILLAAGGKPFLQSVAHQYAKTYTRVVLLCGRYEGIDARVRSLVDEELSIGEYVLTGGELPALVVVDAVTRLTPGVLGTDASSEDESWSDGATGEYPHYTRPEIYQRRRVPSVLLSGDHKRIHEWRVHHRMPRRKKR